jgi:hypothetical protein
MAERERDVRDTRDMVIKDLKEEWQEKHRTTISPKKLREFEKLVTDKVMPGTVYNKNK